MTKYFIPIILLIQIILYSACSKQVQKSPPPEQSQIPDIKSTNIILECTQKSNNGYPFVELSLIIENTQQQYYIATVYGKIHKTYISDLPVFAPLHSISGVSIQNNNTMHHFFVCAQIGAQIIAVQSLVEKLSQNYINLNNFATIIKIPFTIQTAIIPKVIVK
jgi:hypothetical protein